MTVIVWRSGVMTADSLLTDGAVRCGTMVKLYVVGNGVIGISGEVVNVAPLLKWVEGGRRGKLPSPQNETHCHALHATTARRLFCYYDGAEMEVPYDEFQTIGSGRDLAYGALYSGASAAEAAKAAIRGSIFCGAPLHIATCRNGKYTIRTEQVGA